MPHYPVALLAVLTGFALCNVSAHATQCVRDQLTRSVDVVYTQPGQPVPCEVVYEKPEAGSGVQTLWRAQNEVGYCEARAEEFVAKLEAMGFDCTASVEAPLPVETPTPQIEGETRPDE